MRCLGGTLSLYVGKSLWDIWQLPWFGGLSADMLVVGGVLPQIWSWFSAGSVSHLTPSAHHASSLSASSPVSCMHTFYPLLEPDKRTLLRTRPCPGHGTCGRCSWSRVDCNRKAHSKRLQVFPPGLPPAASFTVYNTPNTGGDQQPGRGIHTLDGHYWNFKAA